MAQCEQKTGTGSKSTAFVTAQPKVEPGTVFGDRFKDMAAYATNQAKAIIGEAVSFWARPAGFEKSVLAVSEMHAPFDRTQQEEEFMKAVADKEVTGTIGDLAMIQLQGDTMACMERAFRARHHTSVRSRIHPAARLAGHGAETGTLKVGMAGYITHLDQRNKLAP